MQVNNAHKKMIKHLTQTVKYKTNLTTGTLILYRPRQTNISPILLILLRPKKIIIDDCLIKD